MLCAACANEHNGNMYYGNIKCTNLIFFFVVIFLTIIFVAGVINAAVAVCSHVYLRFVYTKIDTHSTAATTSTSNISA